MNQRAALETLIIFARENEPEEKEVLRALKWGDKRLDVLRDREQRRKIPIPEDLKTEPLVLGSFEILDDLKGTVCRACNGRKRARASFCPGCYMKIDIGVRKALWSMDSIYFHAFNRAIRLLKGIGVAA